MSLLVRCRVRRSFVARYVSCTDGIVISTYLGSKWLASVWRWRFAVSTTEEIRRWLLEAYTKRHTYTRGINTLRQRDTFHFLVFFFGFFLFIFILVCTRLFIFFTILWHRLEGSTGNENEFNARRERGRKRPLVILIQSFGSQRSSVINTRSFHAIR